MAINVSIVSNDMRSVPVSLINTSGVDVSVNTPVVVEHKSMDIGDLTQRDGDYIVIDCGSSTKNI